MPRPATPHPPHRPWRVVLVAASGCLAASASLLGPASPAGAEAAVRAAPASPAAAQQLAVRQAAAQPAARKVVYLTFDDGPNSTYTPKILAALDKYKVRATFFQIGQNVQSHPSVTRRAHERGNSVQNHTWSHPDLRQVSWSTFKSQIGRTDRAIRAQTGYTPRCLRPPYGGVNSTVRERARALNKTIKLWTVDPQDWARPGTTAIVNRVMNNVRPGSIILLHDGGGDRSQTVAALPTILSRLKAQGYTFYRMWC